MMCDIGVVRVNLPACAPFAKIRRERESERVEGDGGERGREGKGAKQSGWRKCKGIYAVLFDCRHKIGAESGYEGVTNVLVSPSSGMFVQRNLL